MLPELARPAAVLWDMDGTLVDTEPYWIAAEESVITRFGGQWTEADALQLVGSDLISAAEYLKQHAHIPLSPKEIVEDMLTIVVERMTAFVPWRPGARELLAEVQAAGVPCALVTMSWAPLADVLLGHLPGVFDAVITGDRVTRPKPHPEPYLAAADQLGVDPNRCVAIEDSPTGLASAVAAGTQVLAVPHIVPIASSPDYSRVSSLTGVTLADLSRIAAGQTIVD